MELEPREVAIDFEAVKYQMRQTKEGHILQLAIHPNDAPPELFQHLIGTRYRVAMVAIGDDEQPAPTPAQADAAKAVRQAAMLCQDGNFHDWLAYEYGTFPDEEHATIKLRELLGVTSRSELKTNAKARQQLERVMGSFIEFMRHEK